MKIKMIVNATSDGAIGVDNDLLFYIPEDLKNFQNVTIGNGNNAVVMGRNTYESIGKVLPKRLNIIITRNQNLLDEIALKGHDNLFGASSPEEAIRICKEKNIEDAWIIGGASIYSQFMNHIEEIHWTEVCSYYYGDNNPNVFIPIKQLINNFNLITSTSHKSKCLKFSTEVDFNFLIYTIKEKPLCQN